MDVRFITPEALWLLLLLPLVFLVPQRSLRTPAPWIRAAVLALLVFAIARPVSIDEESTEHHVLVVDASESVAAQHLPRLVQLTRSWVEALPEDAQASLIELGDLGARAESAIEMPAAVERITFEGARTSLGHALSAAAARIPEGAAGAVTIASDALDTDSGWKRAASTLITRGVPLHSVRLPFRGEVRPVGLRPLAPARVGTTTRLVADLVGDADEVEVLLSADGVEVARSEAFQLAGRGRVLMELEPDRPGFIELRLEVTATGTDASSSVYEAVLPVDDPLRALYVGPEERSAELAELRALVGPGVEFSTALGTDKGALTGGLDAVDLVFLDDRAAESLPDGFAEEVARSVSEDGLGLFASGTHQAFGAGGWQDSPLADVLPVEALQKEEKRDPSVALAIVIDTSGSMGGNRVQLAKETARLAMRRLLPHDKVGIVEFYGAKRWAAPIQPASNNIELERALNRLAAGGGTVILPAIEEAFYGLLNVDARYKHVLVLTDGGVESGAFEPLLRRMASRGITTSTVLIGGDAHSEFLVTLANWGKGRFYGVPNRFNLPEILFKQPTSAKLSGVRPGDAPVRARGGPAWWGDMDAQAVPAVAGLVETELRPGAERILETIDGERPVLSSWRYGLGRVTTMPTEPLGPATAAFDQWPDYGRFLARTLERTARDLVPFTFDVERRGELVRVTARRRTHRPVLPLARLVDREGDPVLALAFEERAPGLFEAELVAETQETLSFEGGAVSSESARRIVRFVANAVPERNVDPTEALDLGALALVSGGVSFEPGRFSEVFQSGAPSQLFSTSSAEGRPVLREWRPWILALALLTYLFDVFNRRRSRRTTPIAS